MARATAATRRESTRMVTMLIPATAPPDSPPPVLSVFTGVAGATRGFTLTASDKSATTACE